MTNMRARTQIVQVQKWTIHGQQKHISIKTITGHIKHMSEQNRSNTKKRTVHGQERTISSTNKNSPCKKKNHDKHIIGVPIKNEPLQYKQKPSSGPPLRQKANTSCIWKQARQKASTPESDPTAAQSNAKGHGTAVPSETAQKHELGYSLAFFSKKDQGHGH